MPVRKASRDSLPGDSEGSVGDGNQEEAQEAEEGDDDSELDSEDDSDDDIKVAKICDWHAVHAMLLVDFSILSSFFALPRTVLLIWPVCVILCLLPIY